MLPHRIPFFLPALYPSSLLWRMPDSFRSLYLTFDDGPVNGPTDFVLETLSKFGVAATFFCIGDNIRKHAPVFSRIVAQGHRIGNHTYNHLNGWRTDNEIYQKNIQQCQQQIDLYLPRTSGQPTLFRPPYGRISRRQIKDLADYRIIMWDVLSMDYNKNLSGEKCLRNTIKASRPGSIVVFHDSYKAEKNLCFVLPRFVEHFLEMGYSFKSLP
jgi:peptidoglycan-N-acetylglucosamine deacetylase